jgi:hypothetical protein
MPMSAPFTLIEHGSVREIPATFDDGSVCIAPEAFEQALGWTLKPEGLCRGDVCVPIRDRTALVRNKGIDLQAFASAVGQPLALDVDERAGALGTAAGDRAAALDNGAAPDFSLPDLEGKLHSLSDHAGKKVLLIVYASW